MIAAKTDCCQEAALGFGDAYIPCNKPALHVIGWKGRSDKPLRMCAMCANHNVKNRGGYVVSAFPPPDVPTPPRTKRAYNRRKGDQKTDYPTNVVEAHKDKLPAQFFAILMAAAGTDGSYRAIAAALNITSLGTVKSRLNRARAMLGSLIGDGELDGTSGQDRDGYSDSQDRKSYIVDEGGPS